MTETTRPFQIQPPQGKGWLRDAALRLGAKVATRALQLEEINDIHVATMALPAERPYAERSLEVLGVKAIVKDEALAQIPRTGPLVVVANHPFGGIEGIAMAAMLQRVRPDVKLLVNEMLGVIPVFRDMLFMVDVFGHPDKKMANAKAMRDAIRFVQGGGCLGIFPSGEVSHFTLRRRTVADPPWNPQVARIIQRSGAQAVPMYFEGANSAVFHVAGLVHPRLRSVMLPREMLRRRTRPLRVRIGSPISHERLAKFGSPEAMTDYLRVRTYLLRKERPAEAAQPPDASGFEPVALPEPTARLAAERAALPAGALLLSQGEMDVLVVRAPQAPALLREVGRLREVCFRAVGEGSGKPLDLDAYDPHYLHLLVWNREKSELVAGYRLGLTDRLMRRGGLDALYIHSLFRLSPKLLEQLGPAIELGRAWVRPEYQKSFAPLMLLWKGIGHFVVRHPRYRQLIGPVSISADYSPASMDLLTAFLQENVYLPDMARLIRPKNPLPRRGPRPWSRSEFSTVVQDVEEVNALVSELERDGKPMPVLLRQYLKLSGELIGFNVDPEFGNVVDGLMRVDLCRVEPRTFRKYCGEEGMKKFLAYHGVQAAEG